MNPTCGQHLNLNSQVIYCVCLPRLVVLATVLSVSLYCFHTRRRLAAQVHPLVSLTSVTARVDTIRKVRRINSDPNMFFNVRQRT